MSVPTSNVSPLVNEINKNMYVRCMCPLCQKFRAYGDNIPKIKTTQLVILILQSLEVLKPETEYHSLTADILPFVSAHMPILKRLRIFKKDKWRKSLLDALNHCNKIESGRNACQNRGFYKLKASESLSAQELTSDSILASPRYQRFGLVELATEIRHSIDLLVELQRRGVDAEENGLIIRSQIQSLLAIQSLINSSSKKLKWTFPEGIVQTTM